MNDFNVGDKVICVSSEQHVYIKIGNIYTVTIVNESSIFVKNMNGLELSYPYSKHLFKNIKQERKIKLNNIFKNQLNQKQNEKTRTH